MEKITSPELIKILNKKSDFFNQQCRSAQALSSQLTGSDITNWIIQVIEPIIISFTKFSENKISSLVEFLFKEMITFLASDKKNRNYDYYKRCWLLFTLNPDLFESTPRKSLKALTSALDSILNHSEEKADKWLSKMTLISPLLKTYDDLLDTGRLTAWTCGLAHLRNLALPINNSLNKEILLLLFNEIPQDKIFNSHWLDFTIRSTGNFVGLDGIFYNPPLLTKHDEHVFISDKQNCYGLFADHFGESLVPCSDAFKSTLKFSLKNKKSNSSQINNIISKYDDITSWEYHNSTLFITTESSYSVFIFGGIVNE